jgi:hypothetical protein
MSEYQERNEPISNFQQTLHIVRKDMEEYTKDMVLQTSKVNDVYAISSLIQRQESAHV